MMIVSFPRVYASALVVFSLFLSVGTKADLGVPPAPFEEVYSVIRSNLAGATEQDLNRAAVAGLLSQLQARVTLLTNGLATDSKAVPLVTKTGVLEDAFGFLRVGRVAPGLASELSRAFEQIRATNKLKGLIVDLRFAIGDDYAAAAEAADLFFKTEQPLLRWGTVTAYSRAKKTAIDLPLVILVNADTDGAAEALAAALRHAEGALVIGSRTAGHAYLFKEFRLSNGQMLRVASGAVATGDGQVLPAAGVAPDITVAVSLEDEKAYFEDPYTALSKPFAQSASPGSNDLASIQSTNRPRRRINEAELVRMQRDGLDLDAEPLPVDSAAAVGPIITDPALSRGLDLLKGLALAFKRR